MSSVKRKCEVRSAGCEARTLKCVESARLALLCPGSRAGHDTWTTSAQQLRTKHACTGLAGARRTQVLYRSLRQLPPRRVRAPLVYISSISHNSTCYSVSKPNTLSIFEPAKPLGSSDAEHVLQGNTHVQPLSARHARLSASFYAAQWQEMAPQAVGEGAPGELIKIS